MAIRLESHSFKVKKQILETSELNPFMVWVISSGSLQDIFCLFGFRRRPNNCLCHMILTHPKLKSNLRKKEAYGIKPLFFALLCVT